MKTAIEEKIVFIAGSRKLSKLGKDIQHRLDNMVGKGMRIFVGDANGADKSVQKYLCTRHHYNNVLVFCMDSGCRNNLGNWPTRVISSNISARKDFAHFSTKDRVMAEEADFGLMLWDGESRGTLTNILDLVKREKVVVVYLSVDKRFYNLRESSDLQSMLRKVKPDVLERLTGEVLVFERKTNPRIRSVPTLF
jgi:hypothetical protein